MLRATLLMLCFSIVAQGQCLAQCLALPCEETHAIHQSAEHSSSVPTSPGNCHDETPEPSENEGDVAGTDELVRRALAKR